MNGQTVLRIGTKLEEGIGRIHVPRPTYLFAMSHAFYYEGSCKPSSHARGLNGSRRQTGEHTCVGRSFVIRFRELCAKLLCITHRT